MRQQRILRINPCRYLIHTCPFRKNGCLIFDHTVMSLNHLEVSLILDMELALVVLGSKEHLHADILRIKTPDIENDFSFKFLGRRKLIC